MYNNFHSSIIMCFGNLLFKHDLCRLTNQCMCGITMETRSAVYVHIIQYVPTPYTGLCLYVRLYVQKYAMKACVVSRVY